MDLRQYIVLNEKEIEKVFWPMEANMKFISKASGSNFKSMVVYDCCREDIVALKANMIEENKKVQAKQA